MPELPMKCPHCGTERIGFTTRGCCQIRPQGQTALLFLQCNGCGEGAVADISAPANHVQMWMSGQVQQPGNIIRVYPEPTALKAPADVPDNVRGAFLSGLDNLGRPGGANAAAIMLRRAIELAVKAVNPNASKRDNLEKRINDLSPDVATPAMKDWAHHVRLDANEAAHEEEDFSENDAKQLQVFAEMFLTYAFTLPKMLERARQPVAPANP